jgi:NhaA family Na+:H+ antiporter
MFNYGGIAQAGAGIPMATDIALHWESYLIRESSAIVFENILNSISSNRRFRAIIYYFTKTILWSNLLR